MAQQTGLHLFVATRCKKIEAQNNAPQGGMQAAANNPFPPQAPAAGSAPIPPAQPSGTNTSDAPF